MALETDSAEDSNRPPGTAERPPHDRPRRTAEARRLLVGRDAPFAPEEAVALLEAEAAREDADALCVLAGLRGGGAWTRHSWAEALDLLLRAAELGSTDARTDR